MTKCVATGGFEDARLEPRFLKGPLQDRLTKMMPAFFSRYPVDVMAGRRKNPLPPPFFACVSMFPFQGIGQRHTS